MKLAFVMTAITLLAGCATANIPESADVMEAVGQRFAGRPLSEMMARYGAPARSMEVGGETIYSWEKSETMYFQTQAPLNTRCQLDAYVRPDGVVRTVGLSGQQGACPGFIP